MNRVLLLVRTFLLFSMSVAAVIGLALASSGAAYAQTTDQWPTSLHDNYRTGSSSDTNISTAQAATLTKKWSLATGGPIASQPAIVNGVAYVGSWDGYEYAINVSNGSVLWKTYLGVTESGRSDCDPQNAGVSSAPTVQNGVVYVGGGDQYWYALNASTGAVEWKVLTGNPAGTYDGHYNWSSPLIVNGYAYVGVASLGDCPLIPGQLLKVDISDGDIVGTLNLVPSGQVGGGIWTSPSYDPATNTIFAVTGTEQNDFQPYAQAIITINPTNMTVLGYWHLPESEAVADSDWTTSPTLFTDENGRQLVMATNKNGWSYAFLRNNIAAGPVWQQQVAIGNDCAVCGYSTVSSAAVGQGLIFQAGGETTINNHTYGGSVQAWDPATGNIVWQHLLSGPVIGAVTYDNGMVIDGGGSAIEVLNATNGQRLYSYDTGPGNWIYAAPAISAGVIITGNTGGTIYALSLPSSPPPTPPTDPNCPANWECQDIGNPTPTGSETVSNGVWNITSGGTGFGGTSDSFRSMSQTTAGDAQIVAEVTSQQGLSSKSQAGIMIRQSNDPTSPFYAVYETPGGVNVAYRNTFGGNTTVVADSNPGNIPIYLEIQRTGDSLQAATSTNGTTFTLVPGGTATVIMPYASLIGLATSSDMNGVSGTATISNVTIGTPNNTPQNTPTAGGCPSGWTCGDIGDPLTLGSQSVSGGTWTIAGAGTGINSSVDQMHYASQTIAGDATVTARITSQTNTSATAMAGLMMRVDTTANSPYYGAFVNPSGQLEIQYRDTVGSPILYTPYVSINSTLPQYVQITRVGTTFTTYTSSNGNNWQPVVGGTFTLGNLSGSILAGLAVTSGVANTTSTMTADTVSIVTGAPTPPTACPGGWTCADVGAATIPTGSQYYYNGTWSVLAGGKDIWDTYDEMHYVYQTLNGNGSVSAQVASQGDSDPWAKAGIMIRASGSDQSSPYFAVLVTPGNGTVIQYRDTEGDSTSQITGVTTTAPIYLKVTRSGSTFTAYTSPDGVNWTAFPGGSVSLPAIPTSATAGLASTSHSQFGTNTTAFDDVEVTPVNASLPSPWVDNDIDNPTPAGSASYANGVYTVAGGGNDIWQTPYGNLDQFHYVSQPLSGNGSIVARITSQTNTSPWAKAGIMIKQSAAADAPYALLAVTPTNGTVFQTGFTSSTGGGTLALPVWLKLTLNGSTVTAYQSTNGTTWTQVGSTNLTLTSPVTVGLFSAAHNAGALSTATFDNVTVTGGSTNGLPTPWADTDVGNPTTTGSASYANGVFTVNGAGNDIWETPGGNLDEFHYVYQPYTGGSETIVARVTSQTNTSPWAKAGVMIKQSTTGGSPYALLGVTPSNGIVLQYGFTSSVNGPATYTFPEWLKLSIASGTVTASTSPDGTTWTPVGTTTLTLTSPATIGLFVCSHASGSLSTVTFDNVTVTSP